MMYPDSKGTVLEKRLATPSDHKTHADCRHNFFRKMKRVLLPHCTQTKAHNPLYAFNSLPRQPTQKDLPGCFSGSGERVTEGWEGKGRGGDRTGQARTRWDETNWGKTGKKTSVPKKGSDKNKTLCMAITPNIRKCWKYHFAQHHHMTPTQYKTAWKHLPDQIITDLPDLG
jgi:hypothetical protein